MEYKEIKAEIFQDSPNNFWGQAFVDDHQVGLLVFTGSSMEEIEANIYQHPSEVALSCD